MTRKHGTAGTRDVEPCSRPQHPSRNLSAAGLSRVYYPLHDLFTFPACSDAHNVLTSAPLRLLAILHHIAASHPEIKVHVQAAAPAQVV
jgi:hypothetical protein